MKLNIPAASLAPSIETLLVRQGIPRDAPVSPRVRAVAVAMLDRAVELAVPAAVVKEIDRPSLTSLLEGEGFNSPDFPLGEIHRHATRLGLYALTLGQDLCREIDRLISEDDYAAGAALDTAASLMAENGAAELERTFAEMLAATDEAQQDIVLGYSPGYCGWHTSGQKRLFEYLDPGRIGITLNESCLMSPVKSVSGVLVAGPAPIHLFEPRFTFCDGCRTRSCRSRHAKIAARQGPNILNPEERHGIGHTATNR